GRARVLPPDQLRVVLARRVEQLRVRRPGAYLDAPADEVREAARALRAAAVDDLLDDLAVGRAERDELLPRPGHRDRCGADVCPAAAAKPRDQAAEPILDDDLEVDAEPGREPAGELELEAARLVRPVIEGGRAVVRQHAELAEREDLI